MSVSSPCELCGQPGVEHSCDRCGSLVCTDHFKERVGLCVECYTEIDGTDTVPTGDELPDGVDTYRF